VRAQARFFVVPLVGDEAPEFDPAASYKSPGAALSRPRLNCSPAQFCGLFAEYECAYPALLAEYDRHAAVRT